MRPPRAAVLRAEDLASGLAGAGLLAVVELAVIAREPGAVQAAWVVAGLYAGVGLLLGIGLTLSRILGDEGRRPLTWAMGAALPLVLLFLPLGRAMFQGAWASTLPGARWAALWVPVAGVLLATLVVYLAMRLGGGRVARAVLAFGLPVVALELDVVNRNVLRSEYPDLHTLLLLGSCLLAALGVRVVLTDFRPASLDWAAGPARRPVALVMALAAGLVGAALAFGLHDKPGRRVIADHGMHGRLLARAVKSVLDFDRDGHAAVLGGGDCKEFDATINPDARDVIHNGVDEDCDGQDQGSEWILPGDAARRQRLARWREEDERVRSFARRAAHMNVLLVVIDALRADSFTPVPENVRAFPTFFQVRRRSRWFTRAFAPAAGTDLSMTGVLTGKANPMTGSDFTLSEILTAAGYNCHAVIPEEVLRFISPTMLTRGFASHDEIPADARSAAGSAGVTSPRTTALGLKFLDSWADRADQPFFLWLHYFDVHEHDQIRSDAPAVLAANGGRTPRTRREKYRAMVKVVDTALGKMLQGLAQRGLADNTIVMVLSDHGESLRESPRLPEYHGRFLYNPLVHVPLAVSIPEVEPMEISHPVSLLDVSQTLRDLLNVPAEAAHSEEEGESLLPLLVDAPPSLFEPPRVLPLHESDQFGIIAWPHKLLVRPGAELYELYDLGRDFDERQDRAEEQPELVRSLLRAYRAFPPVPLDRTIVGRRRWELKAEASRPGPAELAALEKRIPRPPPSARWRPRMSTSGDYTAGSSISPIRRKGAKRKRAAVATNAERPVPSVMGALARPAAASRKASAGAARAAPTKTTAGVARTLLPRPPAAKTAAVPTTKPPAAKTAPVTAKLPAPKPALVPPPPAGRLQRARATTSSRPAPQPGPGRALEKSPR
jgi:arylsulfatase A-like enzyme